MIHAILLALGFINIMEHNPNQYPKKMAIVLSHYEMNQFTKLLIDKEESRKLFMKYINNIDFDLYNMEYKIYFDFVQPNDRLK
jgi:hypothetical protein